MKLKKILISSLLWLTTITFPFDTLAAEEDTIVVNHSNMLTDSTKQGQISFVGHIPDEFGLNFYAELFNYDTGEEYIVYLYKTNNYIEHISLSEGYYKISDISVCDDNTCQYPVNWDTYDSDELLYLSNTDVITINFSLANEDEIIQEIETRKELYGKPNSSITVNESNDAITENVELLTEFSFEETPSVTANNKKDYTVIIICIIIGIAVSLFAGIVILYQINIKSKNIENELFRK